MRKIKYYETQKGKSPFLEWFDKLELKTRDIVIARLRRVKRNNYGDYKRLKSGLIELRFTFGAGYRIYFIEVQNTIILLLCGGNKKTQRKDIKKAIEYMQDIKRGEKNAIKKF